MLSTHRLDEIRSGMQHVTWPPIYVGPTATLVSLLYHMEASQWLPYEQILEKQCEQLVALAEYANKFSPHFQARLQQAGLTPADLRSPENLLRLPVLSRREVQTAGQGLYCSEVPKAHLPLSELKTSGSTGEPVVVKKTAVNNMFWLAITMRDHFWQQRDFSGRLMAIRANIPQPVTQNHWGPPVSLLFESAPMRVICTTTDIKLQIEEIRSFKPQSLLVYPSNLAGIIAQCQHDNITIEGLRHIWCIGETLTPEMRQRAESFFGASVEANYSSQELGVIAVQCPVSKQYHVMSESVVVEIVDEQGRPCLPGQVGKVLVTDLHNFAMPLVRYEVGDYAEVGHPCPCGRHLPVIKAIVGRTRNLVVKPDGSRFWPLIGFREYRDIAPISQFQFIQHDVENVEVRLVVESTLSKDQEEKLTAHIQKSLGHPFSLKFTYFEGRLPRGANDKFEEFICHVPNL